MRAPTPEATARQARHLWASRSTVPLEAAPCSFGLVADDAPSEGAFAYVALSTQLEDLDWSRLSLLDLTVGTRRELDQGEVLARLQDGHIGVVVSGASATEAPAPLPADFTTARDALRRLQMYTRFLVVQMGLDELTDVRGAPSELVEELVNVWCVPLAVTMDLAVLFTLGADRQRYVSDLYRTTVPTRRQALLKFLARRGVISNPLLAV